MTTSLAAQLLRKRGQPERATFLELFFDLVFIFALTRVSQRLVVDITSQRRIVLTEAGQTLLVLLAVWMVWTATALITDRVSAVPWIAGALISEGMVRGALWTVAMGLDYAALLFRLPVPKLGRPPESDLPVVAEHLSERYRQFFIIALGELILVTGVTFSGIDFGPSRAAAFVVSFATTVLMWRIYIYRAGELLPSAIAAARLPGRLAVWLSAAHLLMVIGIVATSAGFDLVIKHPLGQVDPAWVAVILGGPAMFLLGRGGFEFTVFNRLSPSRVVGAVVLGGVAPAMAHTPPLAVAIAATTVLIGNAVADALRRQPRRRAEPSPG